MRCSLWIASALAPFALAAPKYDGWAPARPWDSAAISTYFNQLAHRVGQGKAMDSAPVCDLSKAQLPVASPTPLPAPAVGTTLKHVAIGRGTQNYTCDTTNSTAIPVAIGAAATLYNATCVAATSGSVLATLPNFTLQFNLQFNLNTDPSLPNPANLVVSGLHYFTASGVPFFNLDTTETKIGTLPCGKNASAPAPADATKGQGGSGDGAVPWLRLTAVDGASGNLEEVFRVNTAGGSPPATCKRMPATFEVEYAAEYWFFQK